MKLFSFLPGKLNKNRSGSIRFRLQNSFLLVSLLPVLAISLSSIWVGYQNGQRQAFDRLESVAALKESEINSWVNTLYDGMFLPLGTDYFMQRARLALSIDDPPKYYDFYYKAVLKQFQQYVEKNRSTGRDFAFWIYPGK